jgi:hypothetical protein
MIARTPRSPNGRIAWSGWRVQYRKDTLIARFGGDVLMPGVRHLIAQCPRKDA